MAKLIAKKELKELLSNERNYVVDKLIMFTAITAWVALPLVSLRSSTVGNMPILPIIALIALTTPAVYYYRDKISLDIKAYILSGVMLLAGFGGIINYSFSAGAELTLFFAIAVTFLIHGTRAGTITTIIVTIALFSIHTLYSVYGFNPDYDANSGIRTFYAGLSYVIVFPIFTLLVFRTTIGSFNEHISNTLEKLTTTDERFRRSMDATQDGIWEFSASSDSFHWEPQALQMLGYSEDDADIEGCSLEDFLSFIDEKDQSKIKQHLSSHENADSTKFNIECKILTKSGGYQWFHLRGQTDLDEENEVTGAIGSIRNIEKRKRIEYMVKAQEESYRAFVNNSSEGIWCINYEPPVDIAVSRLNKLLPKGIITEANQAAANIFGVPSFEDMIGKVTPEMLFSSPKERLNLDALFDSFIGSGCTEAISEVTRVNVAGVEQHIRYSLKGEINRGLLYNIWGVTSDITDLRDTQAQLSHAQKMDAIGHLAGGIAHDFNNSLGGIMGAAELMSLKNEQSELSRYIDIILSATERARDLNTKLLSFSRKTKMTSTPIAINPIIDDAIALLRHSIDKRISLTVEHEFEDAHIIGDPSELHSALINLGINARDAMPEGGKIIYKIAKVTLEEATTDSLNTELEPGDYISISVKDTGIGIPQEIFESIFEPFFTTKDVGKGTGLGLAAVYGTVRQHRGGIRLTSKRSAGTTFELLIPAITVTSSETAKETARLVSEHKDKTILIIDDEEMIRTMASNMLEEIGYKTITADSGIRALQMLSEINEDVDGILLDYTMPDYTGEEVFIEIKRHYPGMKVVMGSGFVGEQTMERLQSYGLEYFQAKPYNMSQLRDIFEAALK